MKQTITQILETSNKQMKPADKIKAITKVVKSTRAIYGNSDCDLGNQTGVNTCSGTQPIEFVSDKDKLALISNEIASIRTAAIENTQATNGIIFENEVIKLVSTSVLLSSINTSIKSAII